ncbi:Hypothetical protein ADU72_1247 [Pediococcus damnosus]|uniref:Uncharacterized protein n=1 Tax=Pediococcus damnosus TaxID=51663 RepID=A0ABN4N914_9LACO|nr:Hypothetical protein ADU72_1247 [Pediococcus damnosus]AMV69215.1 Hypothetical protein ADU73_0809 [Pediococcus damnosus]
MVKTKKYVSIYSGLMAVWKRIFCSLKVESTKMTSVTDTKQFSSPKSG